MTSRLEPPGLRASTGRTGPAPTPRRNAWGLTVVTGASSGIGREMALRLAADGAPLVVTGRNTVALEDVCRSAQGFGSGDVRSVVADLGPGRTAASAQLIADAAERAGGGATLVANAGLGFAAPLTETPVSAIEDLVGVNVLAPLLLARLMLPSMLERGEGRLVLVGSIAGALGVRGESVYSATKAALIGFADAVRADVAGTGVTVTLALPGPVDTQFFRRRGVPYLRERPALVPAGDAAGLILDAAWDGRPEVYVPGWLAVPARLRAALPGVYRRLAGRFG